MNSNYVWFGNNTNINIDNISYVMITSLGEMFGSFIFIFLLISTISNLGLKKSKAYLKNGFQWIVIGIAIGILIALFCSLGIQYGLFQIINNDITIQQAYSISESNLNPALIIGSMIKGIKFETTTYIPLCNGLIYISFELLGFLLGSILAFFFYKRLYIDEEFTNIRNCFYATPVIKKNYAYLFSEIVSTFIFVIALIGVGEMINNDLFYFKILLVSILIMGIGYGLGGVTGYILNPFRDLAPRIVYWSIYYKQDKNIIWKSWYIPICGPILGSIIANVVMPGFLY